MLLNSTKFVELKMKSKLPSTVYDNYFKENVVNNFKPLIELELHSIIINCDLQI